jgi:lipoyltransferase and lipoate-protein ligase
MLYISDNNTNPYWNLAAEEYLFKNFDKKIFRLWRNDNAIVVGRYQNTIAEIDTDYVEKNNVRVVRRLTGGGAVFHDLGNLNFTFIEDKIKGEDSSAMFKRFTSPIIEALNSLGVKAYLEGRNDLLIEGKKFSGNAISVYKNRILQHGTLLFSSSMPNLANALRNRPEKFQGKAVQSNRSRVTNISSWLTKEMDIDSFKEFLGNFICNKYSDITPYEYSKEDLANIDKLYKEKYSTDKWNYGESPKYSFKKIVKLSGGVVEIYISVDHGYIKDIQIFGDYFFTLPTENFIAIFKDINNPIKYDKETISQVLDKIDIPSFFNNISKEELLEIFF